jgi:hypothetical protein
MTVDGVNVAIWLSIGTVAAAFFAAVVIVLYSTFI